MRTLKTILAMKTIVSIHLKRNNGWVYQTGEVVKLVYLNYIYNYIWNTTQHKHITVIMTQKWEYYRETGCLKSAEFIAKIIYQRNIPLNVTLLRIMKTVSIVLNLLLSNLLMSLENIACLFSLSCQHSSVLKRLR